MKTLIASLLLLWPVYAQAGSALSFSTDDHYVNVPAAASINDLAAFTIFAWVYPTLSNANRIYSKGTTNQKSFGTFNSTGLKVILDVTCVSNTAEAVSALKIPYNKWAAVAVTFNGTDIKVYVGSQTTVMSDTTASPTACSGGASTEAGGSMRWGNSQSGYDTWQGDIATAMVINRVLTLAQLQDLQFAPRVVPGTVFYSNLGFNGTGTQYDLSGNGNNGTTSGVAISLRSPPICFPRGLP